MWTANKKLSWSYAKIGSVFNRDPRTAKQAVENYKPNGESPHKQKMPEKVRLEEHCDDLAQAAMAVASNIDKLIVKNCLETRRNLILEGNGIDFTVYDENSGYQFCEVAASSAEVERETHKPIRQRASETEEVNKYLAMCLLEHLREGASYCKDLDRWEHIPAETARDIVNKLEQLAHSRVSEPCPTCPVCKVFLA